MKIEFELNEKQTAVLKEILTMPANKGKTANEMSRLHVIQGLIEAKKQMMEAELRA
jgi:hypothetical protein